MKKTEIEKLIHTLEDAVKVCYGIDYDVDTTDPKNVKHTAPFAVGYSRSAMQKVIDELRTRL